ncbi:MAG: 6,7-dimethyl-8-ribityllumazine synthase [Candidatus Liptonbacteria bacterium]|nr:6,7-dimethyl-8-ribityllumazine synthase [Candidatus Liptonbacteria bacterium]
MKRKNTNKKIALPDGSRLRIGIVVSRYHENITGSLLDGALETLYSCGVKKNNIYVLPVPGSFEIPFGCLSLLRKKKYDALVTLGCIIKGETDHNSHIASAVFDGIMNLSLNYNVPISLGVVTTNNLAQAKARSTGKENKGKDAALAAVSMALVD